MKKIFDFNAEKRMPGIVGSPRELAWPCEMFRVTLPKIVRDVNRKFNIFELCALKLLSYGQYEPKDLAEEMCLPSELIETILLRLFDNDAIDRNYRLLPQTLAALNKIEEEDNAASIEYETYVIFRENIGGSILPMLLNANLKSELVSDDDSSIKKGNDIIGLHYLYAPQNTDLTASPPPTAMEVLSAIRAMARHHKASGSMFCILPSGGIAVTAESERCYLRVRLVIQKNTDWRILNPFGRGWSLELESSYSDLLKNNADEKQSLLEWQKRNISKRGGNRKQEGDTLPPAPYNTPENSSNYPELIAALNREESNIDVYAVLEWALYYALKKVNVKEFVQLLSIESEETCRNELDDAINALTVHWDCKDPKEKVGVKRRIPVPHLSKLKAFQNDGMAEMQVVLALAILVARNNPDFPFYRITQKYPDCLKRIVLDMKGNRDKQRHGKSNWSEIYGNDDRGFMRDVVTTLLPSIRFPDSPPVTEPREETDAVFDLRLNARIELQSVFDISTFDNMDGALQNNLLQVEMFRQKKSFGQTMAQKDEDNEEIDAQQGINCLYTAVQCAFRPLLSSSSASASIESAKEKVAKNGLGVLPPHLQTVRAEMIRKTLDGNDQTLGASVIAWIIVSTDEDLQNAASRMPSLLSVVDTLLVQSGHANQIRMMRRKEFDSLCSSTYKLIKTITEV